MATTPPPPSRMRTPPTPLHGPKYDTYEPYSPRRSSRISTKRENHSFQENMGTPTAQSSRTPKKRATFKRTSSGAYSPPSSPISPEASHHKRPVVRSSHITTEVNIADLPSAKNERHHDAYPMPTPAKTPKKRAVYDESHIKSTARVLFPQRPISNDDIMPSPRKARKNKHAACSLAEFAEEDGAGDSIHIFTDSKERIPDASVEDGDDNPFLSRRSTRQSRATSQPVTRNGTKHGMTKEIDEAVEKGEGMVYVFRGKKFYRAFSNEDAPESDDIDELGTSPLRSGTITQSSRGLRRKDIKPRLLFPPKEEDPAPAHSEDEEADTDIDPEPQQSSQHSVSTPKKQQAYHPATPPTTVRKNQHDTSPMWLDGADERLIDGPKGRKAKTTPFDAWQRTKPSLAAKRPLEVGDVPVEVGGKAKRVRGAH